jgi:hypothetical protein
MSSSRPPRPARWGDRLTALWQRLLQRLVFIACGLVLLRLNSLVGGLAGLAVPDTPETITIAFARVLAVAIGLWLLYRGVR